MTDDEFFNRFHIPRQTLSALRTLTDTILREVDDEDRLTWEPYRNTVRSCDAENFELLTIESFNSGGASYERVLAKYFALLTPAVVDRLLETIEKIVAETDIEFEVGGES